MSDSRDLSTKGISPGWEFVNMFFSRRFGVYYCRLRKIEAGLPHVNEWPEITAAGSTMQIAFDNANEEAAAK